MARAIVAALRTRPETVLADTGRLLDLARARDHLPATSTTILKDNISWHLMFPGANTTPWQMEGTIRGLRERGYRDLVCVQNETVVTRAEKGERLNKLAPVLKAYGVPVRYNFRPGDMNWIRYEPKRPLLALHRIFPEGFRIPDFFIGKNVVHQPTMKCHIYTGTTGAMKNAFGGLLNSRRHWTHDVIHETLVDLLSIQQEIHTGIFAIMDGTTAGNGPGPRTMVPVEKDFLLGSADQVAIDAVAAKMMGFDPLSLPYIRLAHERGLGVGDPREIEIAGDDVSGEDWGFVTGVNMVARFGKAVWFGPLHALQKILFRTALVNLFIFGSAAYHDAIWYPAIGRPRIRAWLGTKWGRMFTEYERGLAERARELPAGIAAGC
ncbi:MAG: DUF362 domain-containing protein [Planctomycetes bacterium]|jgi:uncharacterized protein (DUF362 family)|nr:DUF362 domain-containing protein [Planctomycetota bacterium]